MVDDLISSVLRSRDVPELLGQIAAQSVVIILLDPCAQSLPDIFQKGLSIQAEMPVF